MRERMLIPLFLASCILFVRIACEDPDLTISIDSDSRKATISDAIYSIKLILNTDERLLI
jgi:hypothetical protein